MPIILDTIEANLDPKARIIQLINTKEGTNHTLADYVFNNPEIPSVDNRIRNTRLILQSATDSTLYGAIAVWYNRIHGSTLGVLQVNKGNSTTIYQLLTAINAAAGIALTTDDVYDATLPAADGNGLVTVTLNFKPTSLLFYGGAVLAIMTGFTAADRALLNSVQNQNITLSDTSPQALSTASAGVATSASRSDHSHALPGVATNQANGLMSSQDKADLATLKNTTFVQVSNATPQALGIAAPGTSSAAAKADHVHPAISSATTGNNGLMTSSHVNQLLAAINDVESVASTLGNLIGTASTQVPTNSMLGTAARVNSSDLPVLSLLPRLQVPINTAGVTNIHYELINPSTVLTLPAVNTLTAGDRFKCSNCSNVSDASTAPAINFNGAKFQKQTVSGNVPLNSLSAVVDLVWSGDVSIGWSR